jgi:hypothetical protein
MNSSPMVPNQNLINPTKISQIGPTTGFWRSIILDVASIGSAFFFGYAYLKYLMAGLSPWYVLGAFLFFSACSVAQVFLAQKSSRRVLVILGEAVALMVFFVVYDPWQILVPTGGAVFLILLWGYLTSRSEVRNSLEVQFFRATKGVVGKLTTAVLLLMVLLYAPQAQGQGAFIPQSDFRTFYNWASGFFSNFYPGIPFSGSFGDLSQSFAQKELDSNPTFKDLSLSAQNAAMAQAIAQISGSIANTTGVAPSPTEPTSDVIYRAIIATLDYWRSKLQNQFIIAWAIIIFLAVRTIGIVFVWAAQFVSLIVYEVLLAAGFMHIAEVTETKEVVEY